MINPKDYTLVGGTDANSWLPNWLQRLVDTPLERKTIISINFVRKNEYNPTTSGTDITEKGTGKVMGYISGPNVYIVSEYDTYAPEDCSKLFYGFTNLCALSLSNFNTSYVTNMSAMFALCNYDALMFLDLSNFDTSKVSDMSGMFSSCVSLGTLDLSSFVISETTNMTDMFTDTGIIYSTFVIINPAYKASFEDEFAGKWDASSYDGIFVKVMK